MLIFYLSLLDDPHDRDAYEALYLEHRAYLITVAFSVLQQSYDAEDAVHDAFVSLAKHFDKISNKSPEETKLYLTKIVVNAARKIYNKRNKRSKREILHPVVEKNETIDIETIATDFIRQEEKRDLLRFLSRMDSKYRDVLTLSLCYDMKAFEIADTLHRPLATVKTQLRRGKNILVEFLGERS